MVFCVLLVLLVGITWVTLNRNKRTKKWKVQQEIENRIVREIFDPEKRDIVPFSRISFRLSYINITA